MIRIQKSLFVNAKLAQHSLSYSYEIRSSIEFLDCADKKLTELFIRQTGLTPSNNLCISVTNHRQGQPIIEKGEISKLNLNLYVNHNWNPITINWKSQSGRLYQISDTDIICDDIDFYFEKLETDLYIKQLFPSGQKLPFILKDSPYEIIVTRLNLDCTLVITIEKIESNGEKLIISKIAEYIEKFNLSSEKKQRQEGVIHNSNGWLNEDKKIIFEIDLGSVGFSFLKKLFQYLTNIKEIIKVEIS